MEESSAGSLAAWPHLVAETYRRAGAPGYVTTFLSTLAMIALSLAWVRAREAKQLPLLALLILLPLGCGGLGYLYGLQQVDAALRSVSPDVHQQLLEIGRAEAMCNLYIGGAWTLLLAAVFAGHTAASGASAQD